ncbi:hypothetical protein [Paenibacillus tianjinensis]|uniref:F5/8 type C domain-containing protein n=1 Tax=Paenibacillus tianjinensis TaxID=2810347 RepID=A0ABX7LC42_9BACL|nr:hypothetical protein [Paenibacillus tianjinensis]QSF43562.1 hypothetical protein JRJ22_20080 [Paenibacillus tianjinensis]
MATQEIGIPLDLSKGTYNNTIFSNGKLQLIELTKSDDGTSIYSPEGYWISETIRIADKIAQFKYVAKSITGTGLYKIYTQSSNDGFSWSEWNETLTDGSINTQVGYYARVKIFLFATSTVVPFTVDSFDTPGKYNNQFVNSTSGVLELKKSYATPYAIDATWAGSGKIMSALVPKTTYKKVDKLIYTEKS